MVEQRSTIDGRDLRATDRRVKSAEERKIDDMRFVVSTPQGRRVIYEILEFCQLYRNIWRQSAEIHYLAGHQNVGLFINEWLQEVDPRTPYQLALEVKAEELAADDVAKAEQTPTRAEAEDQ